MKQFSFFPQSNGIFMFSLCTFLLLSVFFAVTSPDAPEVINEEVTTQEVAEDFSHCPAIFPSGANYFCPGGYQITGYLPSGNGCVFHWIGSANCQGITANVSQNGNQITVSGTGTAGSFCKFRYKITDDHGLTFYYILGVRIYESDNPLCCTSEPCQ